MNPWQRLRRRRPVHSIETVEPLAGYERWASRYAGEQNPVLQLETAGLQAMLPPLAGQRVLDAGCGTGRVTAILTERDADVTGVDFSLNMLREARSEPHGPCRARFAVADLCSLPFADATFDAVTCSLVLGHVEALAAALGELARVTRTGGTLLVSDFHPFGHLMGWQRSCLERRDGTLAEYRIRNHLHLYESYWAAFRQTGLSIEDVREPRIDESVRHFFQRSRTGQEVYARSQGVPAVLLFRLTRR